MDDAYQAYLTLLRQLGDSLDQLSDLARKKITAANGDDLMGLDEVMKQEQAMTLAFRGMEQTRERLLKRMGCENVPLSSLPERFPPDLRGTAGEAVALLQRKYQNYRKLSDAARTVLERHLREIDAILSGLGGAPEQDGRTGYTAPQPPETPPNMKTDFRA